LYAEFSRSIQADRNEQDQEFAELTRVISTVNTVSIKQSRDRFSNISNIGDLMRVEQARSSSTSRLQPAAPSSLAGANPIPSDRRLVERSTPPEAASEISGGVGVLVGSMSAAQRHRIERVALHEATRRVEIEEEESRKLVALEQVSVAPLLYPVVRHALARASRRDEFLQGFLVEAKLLTLRSEFGAMLLRTR
jgi:hypothetical protein